MLSNRKMIEDISAVIAETESATLQIIDGLLSVSNQVASIGDLAGSTSDTLSLRTVGEQLRGDIAKIVMAIQFQDRTSQTLERVKSSIEALEQTDAQGQLMAATHPDKNTRSVQQTPESTVTFF